MDPRHESHQQASLNHIISEINHYLKNNVDDVLNDATLQNQIKKICKAIYAYAEIDVDIDGIMSKQNLLSIDVVSLPILELDDKGLLIDGYRQVVDIIKSTANNSSNALMQQIDEMMGRLD